MSDMIRKITGINGTNTVNYIPVVYYCVCDTPANVQIKEISWIGKIDPTTGTGTPVDSDKIFLYNGLIIAVKFNNGLSVKNDATISSNPYKLQFGENSYVITTTNGHNLRGYKNGEKNPVLLFCYDNTLDQPVFRLINGIAPYMLDDIETKITEATSKLKNVVLQEKIGENSYTPTSGGDFQFVYVSNGSIAKSSQSKGQDIVNNIKPIWLNSGSFDDFNKSSGANNKPVYVDNGAIKPINYTIDSTVPTGATFTDEKVKQTAPTTSSYDFRLLTSWDANDTAQTNYVRKTDDSLTYNPSTQNLRVFKINGVTVGDTPQFTDTTYDLATTSSKGLLKQLEGSTFKFLNSAGNWSTPPNTTYELATSTTDGLLRKLPDDANQYLNGKGKWAILPSFTDTNYYHSGTVTPHATSSTSGLKASWNKTPSSSDVPALGITIPIYWGSTTPNLTSAVTGSLWIEI